MTRDHSRQRHPENPPEAKTRRETNGPRHRDTPRTGNSKTAARTGQHARFVTRLSRVPAFAVVGMNH
jgi:hypothetical protein